MNDILNVQSVSLVIITQNSICNSNTKSSAWMMEPHTNQSRVFTNDLQQLWSLGGKEETSSFHQCTASDL